MAYTVSLTDLTTTYALLDKVNYKVLRGLLIDPTEARIDWHIPDVGETQIVQANNSDRYAQIPMQALGSSVDTVLNNLIYIKRWVDGAESQALRAELLGDVNPIYLKVQRDTATNATLHRIKSGRVDDSAAHYTDLAVVNKKASVATISLVLAPYGEADAALVFMNDIENSDFLLNDGAGLGAEWTAVGTPTTTLDTSIYLINTQSQKIVTDNSTGEGIVSDNANSTNYAGGESVNAFVWVYRDSGDDIAMEIVGSTTGVIATAKLNTGGWDTYTDPRGQTWSRLEAGGATDGAGENVTLRVSRLAGDATAITTFYVDGAYLDMSNNTATAPAAGWVSYSYVINRFDRTTTNPEYINYIDFWGLPGDAPPLVAWRRGQIPTGSGAAIVAARQIDGKYTVVAQDHWVEADESSTENGGGTGAWSDGTGTSNNNFSRFTEGGIGNNGGYIEWTFLQNVARALAIGPRRVWAVIRASSVARTTVTMSGRINGLNVVPDAPTLAPTADNTWEVLDLGVLNLKGVVYDDTLSGGGVGSDGLSFLLRVTIEDGLLQNDTVDFDALILMPLADEYLISEVQTATSIANDEFSIDGINKTVIYEDRIIFEPSTSGSLWYATPGFLTNRTIFMNIASTVPTYDITDTLDWLKIEVTPRTRHLLGTL